MLVADGARVPRPRPALRWLLPSAAAALAAAVFLLLQADQADADPAPQPIQSPDVPATTALAAAPLSGAASDLLPTGVETEPATPPPPPPAADQLAPVADAAVAPVSDETAASVADAAVDAAVAPVVDQGVAPVAGSTFAPAVDAALGPLRDLVTAPVEDAVDPLVDGVVAPVVGDAMAPVVGGVVVPVVGDVVARVANEVLVPVVGDAVAPTVGPVADGVVVSVVADVVAPVANQLLVPVIGDAVALVTGDVLVRVARALAEPPRLWRSVAVLAPIRLRAQESPEPAPPGLPGAVTAAQVPRTGVPAQRVRSRLRAGPPAAGGLIGSPQGRPETSAPPVSGVPAPATAGGVGCASGGAGPTAAIVLATGHLPRLARGGTVTDDDAPLTSIATAPERLPG
jgi:hypothetical protein